MVTAIESTGPDTRRALIGVCCMFAAHGAFFAALAAYFPVLKAQLGVDEAGFAVCLTALGAGSFVALLLSGRIVSRIGSARAALLGALVASALFAAQPLLSGVAVTVIAFLALGAAMSVTDIAMNVQASVVEQRARANYMTRIHGCWSLGGIAGSVLAGLVIERVPPIAFTLGIAAMFVVAAKAATLLFTAGNGAEAKSTNIFSLPPAALVPVSAMAFFVLVATAGIRDWSAVFLSQDLGQSLSLSVQAFAVYSAATALGRMLGDNLRTQFGDGLLLIVGGLAGFLAMAAGLLASHPAAFFAGVAVLGLAHANLLPILISAAGKFDPGQEPRNVSAVMAIGFSGYMLGPLIVGAVASQYALAAGLQVVAVASLLIAAIGVVRTIGARRRFTREL